jgi:ubiquitin-small subunit ribosomal protein S27Ae
MNMAEKKAEVKKGKSYLNGKVYDAAGGNLNRKNKNCPKCGSGVFLAKHKDRETCGKCGYTEFTSKK